MPLFHLYQSMLSSMGSIRIGLVVIALLLVLSPDIGRAAATPPYHFRVPILMYHYIRDPAKERKKLAKRLSVSAAHLSQQLDWLQQKGYQTIDFQMLASGSVLPAKPIILTFDDGYRDAYTDAFPLLKDHQMKATFYVITGDIGSPNYLTWEQVKEMHDAGMEIAAHTVSHPDLRTLSKERQTTEISDSIQTLHKTLGVTVACLAYPYGKYNRTTLQIVRNLHIPFATTTHRGVATDQNDAAQLPRLRMEDKTNLRRLLP